MKKSTFLVIGGAGYIGSHLVKALIEQLQQELDSIPPEQEVLILTDVYGATPCNIARSLSHGNELRVVTGLNLPMLIRVFNYSDLPLDAFVEKAITGSKEGIRSCDGKNL